MRRLSPHNLNPPLGLVFHHTHTIIHPLLTGMFYTEYYSAILQLTWPLSICSLSLRTSATWLKNLFYFLLLFWNHPLPPLFFRGISSDSRQHARSFALLPSRKKYCSTAIHQMWPAPSLWSKGSLLDWMIDPSSYLKWSGSIDSHLQGYFWIDLGLPNPHKQSSQLA